MSEQRGHKPAADAEPEAGSLERLGGLLSAVWIVGVLCYFVVRALHYLGVIVLPWVSGR